MMKGCPSPNPFADGIKPAKKREESKESPESDLATSNDIDKELVRVVSKKRYVAALKRAVENGEPQAVQRYERALAAQPATGTTEEQLGPVDVTGFSLQEMHALEELMRKLDLPKEDRPSVDALSPVREALVDEVKLAVEVEVRSELESEFQQKVQKAVEEKMEKLASEEPMDLTPTEEPETEETKSEPAPDPIDPQPEVKPKRDDLGVHSLRRRRPEFEPYWRLVN